MKIALLTDGIYPFAMGGMQKHSYYLAKYLAKNNVDVELVHCATDEYSDEFEDSSIVFNEDATKINLKYFKFPSVGKIPGHYLLENAKYSNEIFEYLAKKLQDIDAVYAQGFTGWEFVKRKFKIKNIPVIVNFHGYEMFQNAPNKKVLMEHLLLRLPVSIISKKADYVVSLGGKLTEIIHSLGVDKSKIIDSPVGIGEDWLLDCFKTKSVSKVRRFVYVGRFERRKGVQELSNVIRKLIDEKQEFHFEFIGPIPLKEQIVSQNVIYHDLIKDVEKIRAILRDADVLVCPSFSEGMPTVILEGMASGMAILASDVGAVSSQVNSLNGWLIPAKDINQLKQAMDSAIQISEEILLKKKIESIELVKKEFLWDKVAKDLILKLDCILQKTS